MATPVDDTIPPAPDAQPSPSLPEEEASAPAAPAASVAPRPPVLESTARALPPPPDREALLTRLRQRATALTPDQTAAILAR